MRMAVLPALISGALALAACTNVAEPPSSGANLGTGEVMRGFIYAQENCAQCHAVRAGETASFNPLAPTFTEIANTPGMTRIALSAWMHSEHVMMPHYVVDQDRIDDVWAYLATLKN